MKIITTTNERNMTYDFYGKRKIHAAEWKLNMKMNKNLINALDRSINHPLI